MVKGICDKEKLCLRFCSSVMTNRCCGMCDYRNIYISIRLDRFSFFHVFVHELAHHEMYKKYRKGEVSSRPSSHGKEFRNMFRSLIDPYLTEEIFPPDILVEYKKCVKRWGGIGWNSYPFRLIENYYVYRKLKDLPDGTHFKTRGCGYIKVKHDEASGQYLCYADYGWVLYDANETVELI